MLLNIRHGRAILQLCGGIWWWSTVATILMVPWWPWQLIEEILTRSPFLKEYTRGYFRNFGVSKENLNPFLSNRDPLPFCTFLSSYLLPPFWSSSDCRWPNSGGATADNDYLLATTSTEQQRFLFYLHLLLLYVFFFFLILLFCFFFCSYHFLFCFDIFFFFPFWFYFIFFLTFFLFYSSNIFVYFVSTFFSFHFRFQPLILFSFF